MIKFHKPSATDAGSTANSSVPACCDTVMQELRFAVRQTPFLGTGGAGVGAEEMPYPASFAAQ
ncbi:MAG: hypothetical protein MUC60_18730 [Oscillatoria sp. Prado101]|nr:hypothetical protein [Oscillatoria sp. Prado101]